MQTVAFKVAAVRPTSRSTRRIWHPPSVAAGASATSTVTVAAPNGSSGERSFVLHRYSCGDFAADLHLCHDSDSGRFRHFRSHRQHHCDHHAGWLHDHSQRCGGRDPHQGSQPDRYRRSGPDFTIGGSPLSPATVAAGASSTSTITITRVNGLADPVALTCSVTPAATRGPTCALNPASLTGATLTSTLTVSTTAATTASLEPRSRGLIYAMLLPIGGLALLGTGLTSRKKKLWGFFLGCILFSTLIILPACGGNSSGGGGGGGGHPGTPAGTYTVTVTGTSGSLTHAVTPALTVTVQ